jgi:hypothetical protein
MLVLYRIYVACWLVCLRWHLVVQLLVHRSQKSARFRRFYSLVFVSFVIRYLEVVRILIGCATDVLDALSDLYPNLLYQASPFVTASPTNRLGRCRIADVTSALSTVIQLYPRLHKKSLYRSMAPFKRPSPALSPHFVASCLPTLTVVLTLFEASAPIILSSNGRVQSVRSIAPAAKGLWRWMYQDMTCRHLESTMRTNLNPRPLEVAASSDWQHLNHSCTTGITHTHTIGGYGIGYPMVLLDILRDATIQWLSAISPLFAHK